MRPTGLICAALDCDLDSVEAFNRWYDLEHVPPNVAMDGVMLGLRYVATPALHALRRVDGSSPLSGGHGSFLTVYTLCAPPLEVVAAMSVLRDELYATDRMRFPADKKVVRDGGALTIVSAASSPGLDLPPDEVPLVGHTGILLVRRRGDEAVGTWYRNEWAPTVATLAGVHGVVSLAFGGPADDQLEVVFFEGDAAHHTAAIRSAVPHHADAEVVVEAPFERIAPLHYPWVRELEQSDLPRTIAD